MAAHGIVTGHAVGHFPRVHRSLASSLLFTRRSTPPFRWNRSVYPTCFQPRRPFEHGVRMPGARISAPLTSRPSGVAVQWMTRYFSFPITHRLPLHQRPPGTVLSPPSSPDSASRPVEPSVPDTALPLLFTPAVTVREPSVPTAVKPQEWKPRCNHRRQ